MGFAQPPKPPPSASVPADTARVVVHHLIITVVAQAVVAVAAEPGGAVIALAAYFLLAIPAAERVPVTGRRRVGRFRPSPAAIALHPGAGRLTERARPGARAAALRVHDRGR